MRIFFLRDEKQSLIIKLSFQNIHWFVSMETKLDGIQYVNLNLEHRRKASVFDFQNILQNTW